MKMNPAFKHVQAILAFVVVFLGWVMNAQAVTNPTSLSVKILEMRVSKNSNCSGAEPVFATASPTAVDLFGSPGLGSGVISTGTYHCVMFHISDRVAFVPKDSPDELLCVSTMTYIYDIFQSGASETPEGASFTGTATEDNQPWIYLSDAPTPTVTAANSCFLRANAGTGGPCAMVPLAILSDQTHSLVMDADGQVEGLNGTCVLNPSDPVVIKIR